MPLGQDARKDLRVSQQRAAGQLGRELRIARARTPRTAHLHHRTLSRRSVDLTLLWRPIGYENQRLL